MKRKPTAGAFGDWVHRARTMLEEVIGNLFSPPVVEGDGVDIKTLLGDALTGEVVEVSPAGVTIQEDGGVEYETFVSARAIDSMKIFRVEEESGDIEQETEESEEIKVGSGPPEPELEDPDAPPEEPEAGT